MEVSYRCRNRPRPNLRSPPIFRITPNPDILSSQIIIWDVVAQREMLSYTGHPGGADAVAWSPDGQYVASGGMYDATVQIWHARTGNVVFTFRGHQKPVSYIGWSPDGTTIASVDADQVLIWDAPTR